MLLPAALIINNPSTMPVNILATTTLILLTALSPATDHYSVRGQMHVTLSGFIEKTVTLHNINLRRTAKAGYTHFKLTASNRAEEIHIRIVFNDNALLQDKFSIPEEAGCQIWLNDGDGMFQLSKSGRGSLHITHLDADRLSGNFWYTARENNHEIHIKGSFTARDGLM